MLIDNDCVSETAADAPACLPVHVMIGCMKLLFIQARLLLCPMACHSIFGKLASLCLIRAHAKQIQHLDGRAILRYSLS